MAFVKPARKYQNTISGQQASAIAAEVTGDKEIIKRLQGFRESGIRRVMVAAVRATTREAAKYLKSVAPNPTIKASIGWSATKLSQRTRAVAKAGVNVGKRPQKLRVNDARALSAGGLNKQQQRKIMTAQRQGYAIPAAMWMVVGTVQRRTRRGYDRGRMVSVFSVAPAFQAGRGRTMAAATKSAEKQITKELARAGR